MKKGPKYNEILFKRLTYFDVIFLSHNGPPVVIESTVIVGIFLSKGLTVGVAFGTVVSSSLSNWIWLGLIIAVGVASTVRWPVAITTLLGASYKCLNIQIYNNSFFTFKVGEWEGLGRGLGTGLTLRLPPGRGESPPPPSLLGLISKSILNWKGKNAIGWSERSISS